MQEADEDRSDALRRDRRLARPPGAGRHVSPGARDSESSASQRASTSAVTDIWLRSQTSPPKKSFNSAAAARASFRVIAFLHYHPRMRLVLRAHHILQEHSCKWALTIIRFRRIDSSFSFYVNVFPQYKHRHEERRRSIAYEHCSDSVFRYFHSFYTLHDQHMSWKCTEEISRFICIPYIFSCNPIQ